MYEFMYRVKLYFSFHWDEFVGLIVTSLFAGFIFTFNDWGTESFDAAAGVKSLLLMFLFLLFTLALIVLICKFVSLKFGFLLTYQPHLVGLMAGLVIGVASNGYLPLFLPGGYSLVQSDRTYPGHWRGYQRPWALSFLASLFPILLIIGMYFISLLYILTGGEIFLKFLSALALTAVFSLIPLPNVALEYGGRVLDFFRYLKGTTFGLEIFFNSRTWYVTLTAFVLFFTIVGYLITYFGFRIGIFLYLAMLILGLIVLFMYKTMFEKMGSRYR